MKQTLTPKDGSTPVATPVAPPVSSTTAVDGMLGSAGTGLTDTVLIHHGPGSYGIVDIRKSYRKYMLAGVLAASALCAAAGGAYIFAERRAAELALEADNEVEVTLQNVQQEQQQAPPPPPPIAPPPPPPPAQTAAPAPAGPPPGVGTPKAVPDELANKDATLATQEDMSKAATLSGKSDSSGNYGAGVPGGTGTAPVFTPPEPEPEFFTVVEDMPTAVDMPQPTYPEIAKRAQIQGRVFVSAFVNEQGNVVDAKVVRDIGGGCGDAAVAAVRKWKFTPGKQRGRAVKVQITVPVVFKLK